ncbi:MAG: nickel-binding protein [Nitrososphaeraceae archaeon]
MISRKVKMNLGTNFGVKIINTFYDTDSGTMFCLMDAPDRYAVEKHHFKFGIKCNWITQVKMIARHDGSDQENE